MPLSPHKWTGLPSKALRPASHPACWPARWIVHLLERKPGQRSAPARLPEQPAAARVFEILDVPVERRRGVTRPAKKVSPKDDESGRHGPALKPAINLPLVAAHFSARFGREFTVIQPDNRAAEVYGDDFRVGRYKGGHFVEAGSAPCGVMSVNST